MSGDRTLMLGGQTERAVVRTSDGRRLSVTMYGSKSGIPLLFYPGTPADAGGGFPWLIEAAVSRGMFVVTYARPGYAGSTRLRNRTVASAATDSARVLDVLGISRSLTLGWSGGGPHALAAAILLPERCMAASTIASLAPHRGDPRWFEGMGQENVEEFSDALQGVEVLLPRLEREARQLEQADAGSIAGAVGDGLVSPVDRAFLWHRRNSDALIDMSRAAVSSGVDGWLDDVLALIKPWGISLQSNSTPVTLWHGLDDWMIPRSHSEMLAAELPRARTRLLPDHGHFSIWSEVGLVLDQMLETSAPQG